MESGRDRSGRREKGKGKGNTSIEQGPSSPCTFAEHFLTYYRRFVNIGHGPALALGLSGYIYRNSMKPVKEREAAGAEGVKESLHNSTNKCELCMRTWSICLSSHLSFSCSSYLSLSLIVSLLPQLSVSLSLSAWYCLIFGALGACTCEINRLPSIINFDLAY